MRKLLIKIFLPLFILLLGGYSQAYANVYNDCICFTQTANVTTPAQLNLCTVKDSPALHVKYTQTDLEELNDRIDTTDSENEEDEFSGKKLSQLHKYCATVFSIQAPEYSYRTLKKGIPQCKHFSYFTSYRRYIIFRVIRI